MRKFRIKVEERGEGNLYTPQYSKKIKWFKPIIWIGFERRSAQSSNSYNLAFDNLKEAQKFIQEKKAKEVTKTYYL